MVRENHERNAAGQSQGLEDASDEGVPKHGFLAEFCIPSGIDQTTIVSSKPRLGNDGMHCKQDNR